MTASGHSHTRNSNANAGCLAGVRIVLFAINLPGPAAAARLAADGATVVKVEPLAGDPFEVWQCDWYRAMHADIDVRRSDLRNAEARAEFSRLLDNADVLITAFRPASLERLGLDAETVRAQHPRLCHVAIVGHGSDFADVAGHDLTYQAKAGLLTSDAMPNTLVADLVGVERVVSATYAMLYARERGNTNLFTEVALADGAHDFAEPIRQAVTSGNGLLGGRNPFYSIYKTSDGLLAVAALEEKFLQRLILQLSSELLFEYPTAIPIPSSGDWSAAAGNHVREALQKVFVKKAATDWEQWARLHDLPIAAVTQYR